MNCRIPLPSVQLHQFRPVERFDQWVQLCTEWTFQ